MVTDQQGGTEVEQLLPDPYEIKSIRSVATPRGATDGVWHRYEIRQGHNEIVGFRSGDIANVTAAVEAIVFRLNDRRRLRRGRVHVILQSKSKGPSA